MIMRISLLMNKQFRIFLDSTTLAGFYKKQPVRQEKDMKPIILCLKSIEQNLKKWESI